MAQRCFEAGEWYPMLEDLHSKYFWSVGYINYLILQLNIFGTLQLNALFSVFLNIGVLIGIFVLAKRFFSARVAWIAASGFMLMPVNWFIVGVYCTELPFLFLALWGLILGMKKKLLWVAAGGVLLALANWIRPLGFIYIITLFAVYLFWKVRWTHYLTVVAVYAACLCLQGSLAQAKIGHFAYQARTGGINLVMKANDKATGGYKAVDPSTDAYIHNQEQYDCFELDSIWKARAVAWIKKHPVKYAALCVKGLGYIYATDNFSYKFYQPEDSRLEEIEGNYSPMQVLEILTERFLFSATYYFFLIVFAITAVRRHRELFSPRGALLLVTLLGTGLSCLLAVGQRAHYPLLFPMIIWAAYGLDNFASSRLKWYGK